MNKKSVKPVVLLLTLIVFIIFLVTTVLKANNLILPFFSFVFKVTSIIIAYIVFIKWSEKIEAHNSAIDDSFALVKDFT